MTIQQAHEQHIVAINAAYERWLAVTATTPTGAWIDYEQALREAFYRFKDECGAIRREQQAQS
jgi:hypothetical protein